jgi:hypothetical protein
MMKLHKPEKSTMRSVCMTDTEYHYVKSVCGSNSISKGVRNMYLVISTLIEKTGSKNIDDLVAELNKKFKLN